MNLTGITRLMQLGILQKVFPGAVLLFSIEQEIIYHRAFGVSDIFSNTPIQENSIFDLASLTKPLATTMGLLKLFENQQLFPDQTLSSILSGFDEMVFDENKSDITVEMLMRHVSGLPAHREYFRKIPLNSSDKQQKLRQMVLSEHLEYTPGTRQVYSDLGYIVLSLIIETISEMRLDRFLSETVYTPLGVQDLFFIDIEFMEHILTDRMDRLVSTENCPWRKKVLKGEVHDDNAWIAGGIEGHAGLFGDAESVHAVCCECLTAMKGKPTRNIDAGYFSTLIKPNNPYPMAAGFDRPSKTGSSSGRFFSEKSIGHLGFTGTSFWIDPEKSLIVILLTNRVHPSRDNNSIRGFRPLIHDLIVQSVI